VIREEVRRRWRSCGIQTSPHAARQLQAALAAAEAERAATAAKQASAGGAKAGGAEVVVGAAAPAKAPASPPPGNRLVHVVVTADSNYYMKWQMLTCYYWYQKAAAAPGSALHAFTRILHTGLDDDLSAHVPTVVVPKGPKPDEGAPPIQRPGALIAWLAAAPPAEEYVLMLEPDHILLGPVPLGSVALGKPAAFFFTCAPAAALTLSCSQP